MSKSIKWIIFSLLGLAILLFIVKSASKTDGDGLRVTAEAAKARTITEIVSASGQLYPEREMKVGSPISGEVTSVSIEEGDTVKNGQVLAHIRADKSGSAPQQVSVPNLPPALAPLMKAMQPPRASSSATSATIKAPMDGTVTMLAVKQGDRVSSMQMTGSEMLSIADMNNLEVRVDVNENNIIKISVGDSADIEIEAYNKRKFKGVVTRIANENSRRSDVQSMMSSTSTSYAVHIKLIPSSYADLLTNTKQKRQPFRTGMNARADIKTQKKENVITVPVGALTSRASGSDDTVDDKKKEAKKESGNNDEPTISSDDLQEVVYVIKPDGTADKRVVTTGIQDMNYFEITNGLKDGEQVITGPFSMVSKTIRTGKKVLVVAKSSLSESK